MNGLEVRTALALASVYMLRMLGLFMVMPVLSLATKNFTHYSPSLVGLAIGGYGLTQALLQIPMGILSDKLGRKPVIILGLTVFAIGSAIAATSESMFLLILGRILQGAGAIAGAIMALAADVSRESHRAKVMAIIGIAIGFSFYLALLLGPYIVSVSGIHGIFTITAILSLFCMPLIIWVVPDTPKALSSAETLPKSNQLKGLLLEPQLLRLNLSIMLLHMLVAMLFVQIPFAIENFQLPIEKHWQLYLPVLLLSAFFLAIVMGRTRGQTPKLLIQSAISLMGVCFGMLALGIEHWWLLVAIATLFFTAFNYLEASLPAMIARIAPAGVKGSAMGMYASFQFFGAFLGGIISGFVSEHFGSAASYSVAVCIIVLWMFCVSGLKKVDRIRRIEIQTQLSKEQIEQKARELAAQSEVVECIASTELGVLYLKVFPEFDEYKLKMELDC